MPDKNIKEKIINFVSTKYVVISTMLIALLGIGIFQPVRAKYIITVFILNIVFFLFGKDLAEGDVEKKSKIYFGLSVLFLIYGLLASIIRGLNSINTTGKSLTPLGIILGVVASVFIVYLYLDENTKEIINKIHSTNFAVKFKLAELSNTIKPGDLVLCTDKNTGLPVIIPHKDRYLHMLVLGPTGSGKTSQILIPAILQDMNTPGHGLTVIEPKGDLAEQVDAMGKIYNREVIYFNPIYPDCPYFNPLFGPEGEVIENIATVYKMLANSTNQFFENKSEMLTRYGIMVVKRLYGNSATLLDFSDLIHDTNGKGYGMIKELQQLRPETVEMGKQNDEIAGYFLNEYFNEKSKEFEHCSGIRSQVAKTVSNEYLRRVLNPPNGQNDLDFDDILANGRVLAVSTAQGKLRELSSYLGYFIILNYQSAVFRRPGTEDTRTPHFLYIDEFQTYSNPAFSDMLTQGRSYRVSCTLATQARDQMAMGSGKDGEKFVKLVSTNARNVVLFPGISGTDSEYYSKELGEIETIEETKSTSTPKFSLFGGGSGNGNESVSQKTVFKPRYSAAQIRYKAFKEITYSTMFKDELQFPGDGVVDFIPFEVHKKIGKLVEEYREEQEAKSVVKLEKEATKPSAKDPLNGLENNGQDKDNDEIIIDLSDDRTPLSDFDYRDQVVDDAVEIEDDI